MIPKVIHYCWFGGNPLPPLAEKCIASWKKYLPDYEIKRWDESNFDVNIIPYTSEAYKTKKYAFVSDYARFYILYKYGGLYFDTDVEIIRRIDDIIAKGPFMGGERYLSDGEKKLDIAPGLGLGATPGQEVYKELLDTYNKLHFDLDENGKPTQTVVDITTNFMRKKGFKDVEDIQLIDGVYIYPAEYFNPISIVTKRLRITDKTRSIHHFMASWVKKSKGEKIKDALRRFVPEKILLLWNKRNKSILV
jgi:hypothetical protein